MRLVPVLTLPTCPLHSVEATRAIEKQLITSALDERWMLKAGEASARLARAIAPHAQNIVIACGTGTEPTAILRRDRDRNRIVGERENQKPVDHLIRMQTLAVDRQHVRRRGDNGLELVSQRAALTGLRLTQLVENKDLAL